MGDAKRLLLIDESPHDRHIISQHMAIFDWHVKCEENIRDACSTIESDSFSIGMIRLARKTTIREADIENLVDKKNIEWIAIIDEMLLENSGIKKVISQLFYAYHVAPINARQLDCLLNHMMKMIKLPILQEEINQIDTDNNEMISVTPSMQKLFQTIRKVASVDAPVFISGESGTGKELAARAIHQHSCRKNGPFIAVNCGALPSGLVQSELFGHEKGAFTDARQRHIGRIEAASGGTLFLDEIGDLPLDMQINLLRFLETYRIRRVSGLEEIPVDIRIIIATHVDLENSVKMGKFREDLYHRLNVLRIHIPPLRERKEDIEVLVNLFFDKFSDEKSSRLRGFTHEAIEHMKSYKWPGNVRELINRVRRAMVMCEENFIRPDDLELEKHISPDTIITLEKARNMAEKSALEAALIRNRNNVMHASRELRISRVTLYRLIEKHNINRSENITFNNHHEASEIIQRA
ncbi:hypothetical protein L861_13040 [Litchfieldella anticariensis FP35 = DSM 16096]|uniref:Sigma-54 factor interaction domain-containing protein n=1 Tax=Litchfieldella anticariensis (strain DSM 16096 / CECT 5854 / CIP 108499 / LMG 22089 / FP35) TaxID=1121939 RepID=S2KEW1_LITA3|nr:sigma-54 dependent transcriptional regulator [Halomonas anticariensis]EPC00712.1 hypothetical protein L861_13040 [Halomonas anticariensis FP35 = DSM 16096]